MVLISTERALERDQIELELARSFRMPHPAKMDLNKKWLPKQKTIQNFNIDAQEFGNKRNENPPTREIGVTS